MDYARSPVLSQMFEWVEKWRAKGDKRHIFLNCYGLMTGNMLKAIDRGEFHDPKWVSLLLHDFAGYYFRALDCYEKKTDELPAVWRHAHETTCCRKLLSMQYLLLGINAHINYDLVLTLSQILQPEWADLNEHQRQKRYEDHCKVNEVIADTIDRVQDSVIEKHEPWMDVLDRLCGRMDEWLISRLITDWREEVWHSAVAMVEAENDSARQRLQREVESRVMHRAERIATRLSII